MGNENGSKAELNKLLKETRSVLAKAGPEFTKFLEMVASFGDEIPDEYKRYRAATKALKAASSVSPSDINNAADLQIAKLREQAKSFGANLQGRKAELNEITMHSDELDSRLSELKQQLAALEGDKARAQEKFASKDREIKGFEDNFKKVAQKIEQHIRGVKDKLKRYLSEDYKPELSGSMQMSLTPEDEESSPYTGGDDGSIKPLAGAKKPTSNKERLCAVCNGKLDYYAMNKMWKCFVCGHEEQ